ncbi:MAG: acriflavin resistance protein [Robiginitomaculum sp.]|nr:MAG: acriflavin resistance protein [Robiginitomaculum sp.]
MSKLFYNNPRLAILTVFLLLAAGFGAALTLGRQEDPTLSERFAVLVTAFPGASAERTEALITEPLERALQELVEIRKLNSTSQNGQSVISIELKERFRGEKVEPAWTLVREQINKAKLFMPPGASEPDLRRQHIGADTIIVAFSVVDENLSALPILSRLARDLEQRFQIMAGTEETKVFGAVEEEIRVEANHDMLAALGLDTAGLSRLIAAADAKTPAGRIRSARFNLSIEIAGEFDGVSRIRAIPVRTGADGSVTRVGDIALVTKSIRTPEDSRAYRNGKRVVMVSAYATPNQRVDIWAKGALGIVDDIASGLPPGIKLDVVFQQERYVSKRLTGLFVNLALSALIVFIITFLSMGWRASLIVGSALPLTVMMLLALFKFTGAPLHQMSVTGVVIALGLLIDTAIVMVDEYELMRRRGLGPSDAIAKASSHLFVPLLASTLTTMLAFAPIALMSGGAGEFIGMMGVSVIFAVGSSFVLAMTLIPAFAAWFDYEPDPDAPHQFWRSGISSKVVANAYRKVLDFIIKHPWSGIIAGSIVPMVGFVAVTTLPMQFFPPVDRDMFQLQVVMAPGSSIDLTTKRTEQIRQLILQEPGIKDVSWVIGSAAPKVYYNVFSAGAVSPDRATGFVTTVSAEATHKAVISIQKKARAAFPDARVLALPFEQGPPNEAPIELTISGPNFAMLDRIGALLRTILSQTPGITYTATDLQMGEPVAQINADETATRRAGMALTDMARQINDAFEGVTGGSVQEGVERIPVRVIANDRLRSRLANAGSLALPSFNGGDSLGTSSDALGSMTLVPKISVIKRLNGRRINKISAFLEPYLLPDTVQQDFNHRLAQSDFSLPDGYTLIIGGEAEERNDAMGNLLSSALPLLILIVGAVVLAFNSFSYAAIVGMNGFLSVGLALFGIWFFGQTMGFMAIVGVMGLVGLAINGTIVVLSALKANEKAKAGCPVQTRETVVDATRHIIATTLTTIGGFIPLLVFGDSFWGPLATAIAGGVAGSAVLALITAPAAFVLLSRTRQKNKARLAHIKESKQAAIAKMRAAMKAAHAKSRS